MNINDEHERVNVNDVSLRAVQHARERVGVGLHEDEQETASVEGGLLC